MSLVLHEPVDIDEITEGYKVALYDFVKDSEDQNAMVQALVEVAIEMEGQDQFQIFCDRVNSYMAKINSERASQ
jgi:hypothetical protein